MSEFTVIETQEQFDAAIGERIKRERETIGKKYEGYISPEDLKKTTDQYEATIGDLNKKLQEVNEKMSGYDKDIADRDKKIKAYESQSVKSKIAHEAGLSYEAVDFLKGEDEESIRKSAETLKALMGKHSAPPLADPDGKNVDDKDAALKQTLRKLKGE